MKTRWKYLGVRTIQSFGNSRGIPIPPKVLKDLKLDNENEKNEVILVLDRDKKQLRIIPREYAYLQVEGFDDKIGFELSIPKKLLKKLEKK